MTGTGAGNRLRFEVEADAPPSEPAGSEALSTADASVPSPSKSAGEGTPQAGGKEAKGAERAEDATIPIPAGEKSLGESSAKDKPDAKPEASGNRGEIRALRWSTSRKRIRAVIDCSDGAEL